MGQSLSWRSPLTRPGIFSAGKAERPQTSVKWRPTPSRGFSRARATASSQAASFTIKLAVVRMPSRWARMTAALMPRERPKSSAFTMSRRVAPAAGVFFAWVCIRGRNQTTNPGRKEIRSCSEGVIKCGCAERDCRLKPSFRCGRNAGFSRQLRTHFQSHPYFCSGLLRARHRSGRGEDSIGMARVVLENLSKTFVSATGTEVRAVQRLNLVIEDKELLVLVGPSGSGKTTTLRLIAGLEDATEGAVSIGGEA